MSEITWARPQFDRSNRNQVNVIDTIYVDICQLPGDRWLPYDKLPSDTEKKHIELIKILKELPLSSRLVFNLHVIDGFSHREIARMLDITVKDSKRKLSKARAELQQALARTT